MSKYNFDYEKAEREETENGTKPKKTVGEITIAILQIILSVIMAIIHA